MDRSSGMVIFSSAYTVCLVAILCCIHITYDARGIREDQLISPTIVPAARPQDEPVQYVLMNPLKQDYPVRLEKTNRGPNVLVATLPSKQAASELSGWTAPKAGRKVIGPEVEKFVSHQLDDVDLLPVQSIGAIPGLLDIDPPLVLLETPQIVQPTYRQSKGWGVFGLIGKNMAKNPFSLAAGPHSERHLFSPVADNSSSAKASPFKLAKSLSSGRAASSAKLLVPLEPHVMIANDEALNELRQSFDYLIEIGLNEDVVEEMKGQLNEISENGSLDAGLCEASLYRVLDQAQGLKTNRGAEDNRLIESIREQVIDQVYDWLDRLNGIVPTNPHPEWDEMDYQKLNTAVQSLLDVRFF